MSLKLITVPCLQDNYAYLIRDEATGCVAIVDVPEDTALFEALEAEGWTPDLVLITHHHADHIQGLSGIKEHFDVKVIGAAADAHRLPPLDIAVSEGDTVSVGESEAQVIDVSGHTVGHIAFHFAKAEIAFTADSLMALGCGRVFEGTMTQMWESLSKLAALPGDTLICSGHEYTAANAKFALTIEPDNKALQKRVNKVSEKRAKGLPTVPTRLSNELGSNPFIRADQPEVKAALGMASAADAEVFAEIRRRKDAF